MQILIHAHASLYVCSEVSYDEKLGTWTHMLCSAEVFFFQSFTDLRFTLLDIKLEPPPGNYLLYIHTYLLPTTYLPFPTPPHQQPA